MTAKYIFTVFTPTYNRRHTLHRTYAGLLSQTFKDFEWLIIDDGSSDGTRELVSKWIAEGRIPIRYYFQENSGKHIAINHAASRAEGELFAPIDSDDNFLPSALERYFYHWQQLDEAERLQFSGVCGLCVDERLDIIGKKFPADVFDSSFLDIRYKYKINGEKCAFVRTDIVKEFPFPEITNSYYVPENIIHHQVARKYKTRFINEVVRIYYAEDSPLTRQVTRSKEFDKTSKGLALWHQVTLCREIDYFLNAPKEFLRSAVHYPRFSAHQGVPIKSQYKHLNNPLARTFYLTMILPGYMLYLKDLVKYGR